MPDDLAERLYTCWAKRQGLLNPTQGEAWYDDRIRPRPRWSLLTAQEQGVWRAVAAEAQRTMGSEHAGQRGLGAVGRGYDSTRNRKNTGATWPT